MDPFNALSIATVVWNIPMLKEAPTAEVMSCALVRSTDLEKTLDAAKEVIGGAGAPSVKMGPSIPSFTIAPFVDSLLCYRLIRRPKSILQDSPKI
jgi:hypothetical protein